ncbi:MAG TPA: hypothetical protein VJ738_01915 [Steroidobacteraceae bacterium]|nr:hypothetical protein [Steroidobacteraceae bacterium]
MSEPTDIKAAREDLRATRRYLRLVWQLAERIEASARRGNAAMIVLDTTRLLDLLEAAAERHSAAAHALSAPGSDHAVADTTGGAER